MDEIKRFDPFPDGELAAAAAARRLRLMVIDDDRRLRETLKAGLGEPYEVVCLPQGLDALEELEERQPGLLILDLSVSGNAGAELCQKIRAHATLGSLPILFMTSPQGDAAFTAGRGAGGDYFITKPFEIEALRDRIEVILDGQPSPN